MNRSDISIISTANKELTISIKPCDRKRDGQFIRELTKENCYHYLRNTIGWDESRHLQEPKFPDRYLMLFEGNNCIGFLALREQDDYLYLHTLQLIQQYRRQGIGTKLLEFIEYIAKEKAKNKIRLRVINGNPALSLYRRNGYEVLDNLDWCLLMQKTLNVLESDS